MVAPSVLFDVPMCCEVMGAGFQKVPWCNVSQLFPPNPPHGHMSGLIEQLYELRWPRLQKIYEPRERPWTRGMSLHLKTSTMFRVRICAMCLSDG